MATMRENEASAEAPATPETPGPASLIPSGAVDPKALFLGPKAENQPFFMEMLDYMMDDHSKWREYFHPDDPPAVTEADRALPAFQETLLRTRQTLVELAGLLQVHSVPWFSPRYLGHMNADTLMAANLAYMLAMIYNPNNVAYEGSPATTDLELEVGRELGVMLGYDSQSVWGHITSGGTVANYEALWIARNLRSAALAAAAVIPAAVAGKSPRALLGLPPAALLDLLDKARAAGATDALRAASARGRGLLATGQELGVVIVPRTKHYSWVKAMDILGLGQDNLVEVEVGADFRMDIKALRAALADLDAAGRPVLMVVAVVGSTEEGAVDPVHQIAALRKEREAAGLSSFFLHVDAAFGGYARCAFLAPGGRFMEPEELPPRLAASATGDLGTAWPSPMVYAAYRAIPEADSVTIDPHKLGYIPYAAGAFVLKDRRGLDLVSYFASYVFDKADDNPRLLGSYILEGSKAGAAAAAIWAAHRVVPLDAGGYGRLIGASIEGAGRFHAALSSAPAFVVGGKRYRTVTLTQPDLNMVDFLFHEEGQTDLSAMNALNAKLYEGCSSKGGPLYAGEFITSKTSLTHEEYGDAPLPFIRSLGLPESEWRRVGSVFVLRSSVLTPNLAGSQAFAAYWDGFLGAMARALAKAA